MKKIIAIVLCIILSLSMIGCNRNKKFDEGDVTMVVVQESVTPLGLTVHINIKSKIDVNGGIDYDFTIEKKENGEWVPVQEIGERSTSTETYIFQGERDLKIYWSEIYGELIPGEYRVVKFFYPGAVETANISENGFYLTAEFIIE